MTINAFAEQNKLRVRRDECGDKIIPGKRGHLYVAGNEVCLMVVDGTVVRQSRWQNLGARTLWLGDITVNAAGVRVQDVKAEGIPEVNWKLATTLAKVRLKRTATEEQIQHLRSIKPPSTKTHLLSLESITDAG